MATKINIRTLLEAGCHFGHQTRRWNPKMKKYIFTERNGIYIIDLQKTVKKLDEAYNYVKEVAAEGGDILFVGTKKQAQESIRDEALRCGMHYVNARWLGGMLTNFRTIRKRIDRMEQLKTMQEDGKNYGDFLLDTVEAAKEQFTDKEYEWLKESATEISNIENRLTELEEKYPEIMQNSMDGDMSMPAGSDTSTPPDDGSMQKFPAFEGKDLDGNTVKSDELFSANAVTVVNFWFTTCNPCVGELPSWMR